MVDQVNTQGVPVDDDTIQHVSADIADQSPLQAATAAPTQASARRNAANRFQENTDELSGLRQQYTKYEQQQADAYSEQKKLIDEATQRLLSMPTGPSQQEMMFRIGAAGARPNHNGIDIGAINEAQAQGLQEARQGELQKQQLLAEYGMKGPDSEINQTNALMSKNLAEQRVAQSGANSAGNQQFRGQANMPWYVRDNGDGTYALQPGAERIMDQEAMTKLFGRFTLLPQPDGTKKIVTLGGQLPSAPQPAATTPAAPGAAPAAPPRPVTPQQPQTQIAPPGAPPTRTVAPAQTQQAVDPKVAQYNDLFTPSTVLDPKYGALTPQTKPAYVQTAVQAFDPQYFQGYTWHPTHIGDDKTYQAQVKDGSKQLAAGAEGAEQTIYNYGEALQSMDALNDKDLLTGPVGKKVGAAENALRGVLGDDMTQKIFGDPDFKALASQQDQDKYFRQAASNGLKAIYGSRVSNMEVQQRLLSLPNVNLLPAVTRMLAQAQAEVAQDTVTKGKVWSAYLRNKGDPDPSIFNTWYEANFSPFHDSRLKANLQQKPAPAQAAAPNPIVAYYLALDAWNKADPKTRGPRPTKPQ